MGITRDFSSTYFVGFGAPGPILYHPTFSNVIVSLVDSPDRIEAQDEAEDARGWHIIDLKRSMEKKPGTGMSMNGT